MRAVLVAVLVLAAAAPAVAGDGLVARRSRAAGFTVRVPAAWTYRNASYPSDHSTELWRDPRDSRSWLDVEVSACAGCAQPESCTLRGTGCGPAPGQLVPERATARKRLDRWRMTYLLAGAGYPERGLVVVLHDQGGVTGFALARVRLPAAQSRLAAQILASFRT